jgi:hypothetical protein
MVLVPRDKPGKREDVGRSPIKTIPRPPPPLGNLVHLCSHSPSLVSSPGTVATTGLTYLRQTPSLETGRLSKNRIITARLI